MKRIFAVFVSMLLLSLLCACGGDNSSAQETPSEPEEPTVEPVIDIFQIANKNESEVASVLGDPVLSENGNFTLNSGEKIALFLIPMPAVKKSPSCKIRLLVLLFILLTDRWSKTEQF